MLSLRPLAFALLSSLFVTGAAMAQDSSNASAQKPLSITITASASTDRVRITASTSIVQMHVEIYAVAGEKLFDNEIRGGNVFDWHLQDGQAQHLSAGDYVCVVTVKNIAGRLTQKIGTVRVGEKDVSVQPAAQLSSQQSQAIGPMEENSSWTILEGKDNQTTTVIAHDGTDGEIVRGRGALSFRVGDFFSGNDKEQMRLTEEGNLGIGTSKPQFKLDVAGAVRAREGFVFNDGSTLNVNDKGALTLTDSNGNITPNISGTGTQNRLAKWTDNAGTLGDSLLSESGNNIVNNGASIQMTAAPSTSVDTNLIFVNGNDRTTGVIASSTPAFTSVNGPYFAMRGNTYNAFAGQRGLFAISAGNVSSPTGREGSVIFNTGADQIRMIVSNNGNVGIATLTPNSLLDVAGDINTSTQYNIGGNRVFSIAGTNNTFMGNSTGNSNTGTDNSFFGANAGQNNTSGGLNSFFGSAAGQANNTGNFNSFFGGNAGAANTTGTNNSFFGTSAGATNTTGTENSFFGSSAGYNNKGDDNSFFGRAAGYGNTTGIRNSYFGSDAGLNGTTGNDNSFFGYIAGVANQTGSANSFFGTSAGAANTTGGSNSFFGRSAGEKNTSGIQNSFVGTTAGFNNTTAPDNSFFGYVAGFSNTTGAANSFFGSAAGADNTTGAINSFFGRNAGNLNTSGSNNSFFGGLAGNNNTTGSNNSFFGETAGLSNTAENNNSFIGANANGVAGITNAMAIGANAQVLTSNSLVLGSINGVNGATADTNVGIGVTSPEQRLSIGGGVNIDQNGANNGSIVNGLSFGHASGEGIASDRVANSNQFGLDFYTLFLKRMSITQSGKVGIGTTTPDQLLSVAGGMNIDQGNQNTGTANFSLSFGHISGEAIGSQRNAGLNPNGLDFYTAGVNRMSITNAGDVGIGFQSPVARLSIMDGSGPNTAGAHVQIGASFAATPDEKIIQFGNAACSGPCAFIGQQDAGDRMVLRAGAFRVKVGNWDPDADNTLKLGESGNRWKEVWAANGMIQTSDARLKKGISNLRYGLSQVLQLRPVTFQWKEGGDRRTHLGLIAQEVEPIMPEMIERGADPSQPLGMNYDNLIPVLIKAVQEQQTVLERSQIEIKNLRAENNALSRRIVALELTRRSAN